MLDRRSFLIGAGGLLTASFVRKATAFSRKAVRPFLLSPAAGGDSLRLLSGLEGLRFRGR